MNVIKITEVLIFNIFSEKDPCLNVFDELFENILHNSFSKIISKTLQTPIETFLHLFQVKRIMDAHHCM